jgi:hypothetical protein
VVVEGVRKAARVAQQGCLKDDRRRGGGVDSVTALYTLSQDKPIGFVVDGAQERLDAVEVEVIGDDGRAEPR